jgi:hypothetical protein
MPKTKSEMTPVQQKAQAAREAHAKAKEAHEKNDNANTRKALETATAERDAAVKAENRERFERIGGPRVQKAITALANVGKLAAPRSYHYDEEDVNAAEKAIMEAAKSACASMRNALNKGGGKSTAAGFAFKSVNA